MKIAYLILAHTAPQQIIRAMDRLRATGTVFVVHIDARSDASIAAEMAAYAASVVDVVLAPRARCYWGTYGIVQATLNSIAALLRHGQAFDYAVLISGQDYPIKSPAEIASFFKAHAGTQFIESFPLASPNRWTAQAGAFQAMARVLHYTFTWRSKRFHLPAKRRFYAGWTPHGGSQWWALSSKAIRWVAGYLSAHPALVRYYRLSFIPDESMIQTMLANSPFAKQLSTIPVHYIDWDRPNPKYPRTLDDEDLGRLTQASELFARKMHPELSAHLLDWIDEHLLGSYRSA